MTQRRNFLRQIAAAGIVLPAIPLERAPARTPLAETDREYWLRVLERVARPVLDNVSQGRLHERMPVETSAAQGRREYSHLEALGRLLAGIAPWLELGADESTEGQLRRRFAEMARDGLRHATDPASPDYMNFSRGSQPLVDAAFLAHAIVRAPQALLAPLDSSTKSRVVTALESTRVIRPSHSNWLMFSAMVETALSMMGASWDRMRVDYALRSHETWYKGDGVYGDGPNFHWDYYNSFVIQPMLLDVIRVVGKTFADWNAFAPVFTRRAVRYAAIQERSISPEGTFPPIGRSLAYRFGAFQLLGQMALRQELPEGVKPAQVRGALTAVIRRMIEAPGTFDANGWLTIGFAGHQPAIAETYISTGSLYLCAAGLLPLGLPASSEFWSAAAAPWTAVQAWRGDNLPADHAI
jgi:hypothetical protein